MKPFSFNSPEARHYFKYVTLLVLIMNGTAGVIGGLAFILYSDGSAMGMPVLYLAHSPFQDYFIPGLILFSTIGVLSLVTMVWLVFNFRHHAWLVMGEGVILCAWILIQIIMLREVNFFHVVFGVVGIALIVLGGYLRRFEFK